MKEVTNGDVKVEESNGDLKKEVADPVKEEVKEEVSILCIFHNIP